MSILIFIVVFDTLLTLATLAFGPLQDASVIDVLRIGFIGVVSLLGINSIATLTILRDLHDK